MAEGKQVSYADLVPVLELFKNSPSHLVIDALYTTAAQLRQFVEAGSAEEANLRAFYNDLSKEQVARLGWMPKAGESDEDIQMRPYILSASLYGKNEASEKQAHEIYVEYQDKLASLSADIRAYVLINEVENYGSSDLTDKLVALYQATSDPSFKMDLEAAIVKSKDEKELKKIISWFENAEIVKPQDLRGWFRGVLSNAKGEQLAWDWIRDEWAWMEKTVGGDMEFATFITVISKVFKTQKRYDEFDSFFTDKESDMLLNREIKMDRKVIASRVDLIASEKDAVNAAVKAAL